MQIAEIHKCFLENYHNNNLNSYLEGKIYYIWNEKKIKKRFKHYSGIQGRIPDFEEYVIEKRNSIIFYDLENHNVYEPKTIQQTVYYNSKDTRTQVFVKFLIEYYGISTDLPTEKTALKDMYLIYNNKRRYIYEAEVFEIKETGYVFKIRFK